MSTPEYIAGQHWSICMRCGSQRRKDDIAKEWTNLLVCKDVCFDPVPAQLSPPNVWPEGLPVPDPSPVPPYIFVDPNTPPDPDAI